MDARKRALVERYGAWTAHDVQLAEGVWTRDHPPGDAPRLRRVLQLASDLAAKPVEQLRVLDLGCLEGQYAIEFALHGAEVVGIEGREANLAKAWLAKEVLGLERLELIQDDVRRLDPEVHGSFDVVLCLGLLYHLDATDVFGFLARLRSVCHGLAVVDTHVCLAGRRTYEHHGQSYRGLTFVEHSRRASGSEREASRWASLDNSESFWPTRASLLNGLQHAGFTSVLQCEVPVVPGVPRDRVTMVATAGEPVELRAVPSANAVGAAAVPEAPRIPPFIQNQSRVFNLLKRAVLDVRARRSSR
ncbi:MAG: methyltransferase domain-containing protein [Thermoleophilaceae bacterium]|nr:methyltransferase domain-containing protein [Thermoleophilaceae bacterium]